MKRPLAYITAAWCGEDYKNTEQAARYCRAVYFSYLPHAVSALVPQRCGSRGA